VKTRAGFFYTEEDKVFLHKKRLMGAWGSYEEKVEVIFFEEEANVIL
jgi:hypothetical protein